MGSSNDGSDAALGAEDDPTENGQRGFLSRIISALSSSEPAQDPKQADAAPAAPSAPGVPGIGNLRRLRVDDVAIPKVEITAVPVDIGREELVAVFRKHGFSRLPVYEETLDKPLGLVLLKDLALQFGFGQGNGRFNLRKLIETVIGEIEDEHDEADAALWIMEKPGVYLAHARAPLEEIEAAIGLRLRTDEDDEEIDTLGGLVFLRTGRVPARGEIVPHESGVAFEVIDADPRRIKRLRLRLPGAQAAPAALLPPAKD